MKYNMGLARRVRLALSGFRLEKQVERNIPDAKRYIDSLCTYPDCKHIGAMSSYGSIIDSRLDFEVKKCSGTDYLNLSGTLPVTVPENLKLIDHIFERFYNKALTDNFSAEFTFKRKDKELHYVYLLKAREIDPLFKEGSELKPARIELSGDYALFNFYLF